MIKLKKLYLQNFCGYKDEVEIDFEADGGLNNILVLYGPNGAGKSTILNAIHFLANVFDLQRKDKSVINAALKSMTYHKESQPGMEAIQDYDGGMLAGAIFDTDQGDKRVIITDKEIELCELPYKLQGHSYLIDADHPMNVKNFQISDRHHIDKFLDMAQTTYGFPCELGNAEEVVDDGLLNESGEVDQYADGMIYRYFTDLIIDKGKTRVHYKKMSAGEKKIATLLRYITDPNYINNLDIVLIDNIEMHVYFKRHGDMMNKIIEHFLPDKQFIVTTHSYALIKHMEDNFGPQYLCDVEELKKNGAIVK